MNKSRNHTWAFVAFAVIFSLVLIACLPSPANAQEQERRRPNIVLLEFDDDFEERSPGQNSVVDVPMFTDLEQALQYIEGSSIAIGEIGSMYPSAERTDHSRWVVQTGLSSGGVDFSPFDLALRGQLYDYLRKNGQTLLPEQNARFVVMMSHEVDVSNVTFGGYGRGQAGASVGYSSYGYGRSTHFGYGRRGFTKSDAILLGVSAGIDLIRSTATSSEDNTILAAVSVWIMDRQTWETIWAGTAYVEEDVQPSSFRSVAGFHRQTFTERYSQKLAEAVVKEVFEQQ